MKKQGTFYLIFDENYFNITDQLKELEIQNEQKLEMLENPHKKWWKQLFQFITFGIYRAPYQYKCKIIEQ